MDEMNNRRAQTEAPAPKKKKKAVRIAVIIAAAVSAIFLILALVFLPSSISGAFIVLAALSLVAGVIVVVVLYSRNRRSASERKNPSYLKLPIAALLLDTAVPGLLLLLCYLFDWNGISLILLLFVVLSPMAGIVVGSAALSYWKKIERPGIVMAVIAIVVPVIAVLVVISLFATGNIYIGM